MTWRSAPASPTVAEGATRTSGYSWLFSFLAAAASDVTTPTTQSQDTLRLSVILHPAVVLVLKTSLSQVVSWQGSEDAAAIVLLNRLYQRMRTPNAAA